jgi:hypothetical protein
MRGVEGPRRCLLADALGSFPAAEMRDRRCGDAGDVAVLADRGASAAINYCHETDWLLRVVARHGFRAEEHFRSEGEDPWRGPDLPQPLSWLNDHLEWEDSDCMLYVDPPR